MGARQTGETRDEDLQKKLDSRESASCSKRQRMGSPVRKVRVVPARRVEKSLDRFESRRGRSAACLSARLQSVLSARGCDGFDQTHRL